MKQAERWRDSPDRDFVLAVAGEALGRRDVARAAESRLLAGTGPANAVRLAELYAHRGQVDEAFRWINLAYDRLGANPWLSGNWQWVYPLRLSPFLEPLHDDPRWAATRQRGTPAAQVQ
jgi:hypothetical protein